MFGTRSFLILLEFSREVVPFRTLVYHVPCQALEQDTGSLLVQTSELTRECLVEFVGGILWHSGIGWREIWTREHHISEHCAVRVHLQPLVRVHAMLRVADLLGFQLGSKTTITRR